MTRHPRRLMFRPELKQVVGSSYTTIWKLMRQGKFPRSVVVGKGRVGWFADEVQEYLENLPRQKLKGDSAEPDKTMPTTEIERQEISSPIKRRGAKS